MPSSPSENRFSDDVARGYEANLVPLIFTAYATDLAARVRSLNPDSVLEVACGTGVVTRALSATLARHCAIVATDLNQAMVEHGKQIGTDNPVTWRQADAMALPYSDGTFDLVVCQFGVMFFPDRVRAYREIRRVLRPGGSFLFNIWNGIAANEFAHVVSDAAGALFPADPPDFLSRTPHGHGSTAQIESDLSAAGFSAIEFHQRDDVSTAATPDLAAVAYCHGTPLRHEIEARDPIGLARVTAAATQALRERFGNGPISGRISAVVVVAS
jgi:ubiquinone/menaquinone biosynthesis C-methylase UbiE